MLLFIPGLGPAEQREYAESAIGPGILSIVRDLLGPGYPDGDPPPPKWRIPVALTAPTGLQEDAGPTDLWASSACEVPTEPAVVQPSLKVPGEFYFTDAWGTTEIEELLPML